MLTLEDVANLVEGTTVALVGNASSLLDHPLQCLDIDRHDLVVRMNLGVPTAKDTRRGRRMDIWAGLVCPGEPRTTMPRPGSNAAPGSRKARMISVRQIHLREHNTTIEQAWVVPFGRWLAHPELEGKVFDGKAMMDEAKQAITNPQGGLPTTGFTVGFMLLHYCSPWSVTLYGFDGFTTPSLHSRSFGDGHNGKAEMEWMQDHGATLCQ